MINYKEIIENKLEKEYSDFIAGLEQLSKKEIINKAYKIIFYEDIKDCVLNMDIDEDMQKKMAETDFLLEELYQEWLHNDYSYTDDLINTIYDCFEREF